MRRDGISSWTGLAAPLALVGAWSLAGATEDLAAISPLVWVMVAMSVGGAAITYGFLYYAIWRFKDPSTRRRNYG